MAKSPSFYITQDIQEIEPTPDGWRQFEPVKESIRVHCLKDKELKRKMEDVSVVMH